MNCLRRKRMSLKAWLFLKINNCDMAVAPTITFELYIRTIFYNIFYYVYYLLNNLFIRHWFIINLLKSIDHTINRSLKI
nr:MAG TPA: hypothetical protein [Caudoviricetes sp.]